MDSFTASLTVTEDVSEQTSAVAPLASDLTRDASVVLSDTANKLNFTTTVNRTIPWDNQTALDERFQQWARLENLPDFRDWEVVQFFAFCIFAIFEIPLRYSSWQVVATLAVIEAPQTTFRNDRNPLREKEDATSSAEDESYNNVTISQQALTTSLQGTVRRLVRVGGWSALCRGVALSLCFILADGIMTTALLVPLRLISEKPTSWYRLRLEGAGTGILTEILLAHWAAAHTHIVITEPTFKIWYRRLPGWRKSIRHTALPILLACLAQEMTTVLPQAIRRGAGVDRNTGYLNSNAEGNAKVLRLLVIFGIWLLAQAVRLSLWVPAGAILTRIQASMLPDDQETIVPMDKSFGTQTRRAHGPPGILSPPSAILSFRAALSSFTRADAMRILRMYAKLVLVEVAFRALFTVVLGWKAWPHGNWNPT